jgi:hypothetical protein
MAADQVDEAQLAWLAAPGTHRVAEGALQREVSVERRELLNLLTGGRCGWCDGNLCTGAARQRIDDHRLVGPGDPHSRRGVSQQ